MTRRRTVAGLLGRVPSSTARQMLGLVVTASAVTFTVGVALGSTSVTLTGFAAGLSATVFFLAVELKRTRVALARVERRLVRSEARLNASAQKASVHAVEERVADMAADLLVARHQSAFTMLALNAAAQPPAVTIPSELVANAVASLVARGDILDASQLATAPGALDELDAATLRALSRGLKQRGYLASSLMFARYLAASTGLEDDDKAQRFTEGEIKVLTGDAVPALARTSDPPRREGRIIHLVGNSLPEKQSGYTIRTQSVAVAQRALRFDPHVITQLGFPAQGTPTQTTVDGITYHRIPGPQRHHIPMDEWLDQHVRAVYNLVRELEPDVIHAASDFVNAITAKAVGDALQLPVVYESRGFWEETWLSRQARRFGWEDLENLERRFGLPDVYERRKQIEDTCRSNVEQVVTLDEVMARRIVAGGVARERVWVVPNAVDIERFPRLQRNEDFARRLGFEDGVTIIGYISSLVEYEGIDTLIDAFAGLQSVPSAPRVGLLIVGDGPDRRRLERRVVSRDAKNVVFTGQVPHDEVLNYYGAIDIFVVPRHPVEVCHLVTPLKPYEAFATGRTVVLSDVRALASIAKQSHAAELFRAGDPDSLTATLAKLLDDPQRRETLAEAGATWVRRHRTWLQNADTYAAMYEAMGIRPRSDGTPTATSTVEAIEVERIRRSLSEREPIPFEHLSGDDADSPTVKTCGWALGSHPPVRLELPLDWEELCMSDRSWNFHLHSWDFMEPVLKVFERTRDVVDLDWCVAIAESWAKAFDGDDDYGTMAWYDMALGLRAYRLAYLVEQALQYGRGDTDTLDHLLVSVLQHRDALLDRRSFNPRNNHGVFTAIGGLALARRFDSLPGMDVLQDISKRRLTVMARQQFLDDGGHAEHSPDYHMMLVATFSGALKAALIDDEELRQRIVSAEDVLGWYVDPAGHLVQIGDTPQRDVRKDSPRTTSPTTEFQLSRGQRGTPDTRTLLALHQTGFAAVRAPQPQGTHDHRTSGYLTLAAGFHSRVHKHADDLSITWFDRGQELLIDAGRFGYVDLLPSDSPLRKEGYYYGAPERQYVESTRAHNTVECDGIDHARRARRPYGSALRTAEERDGYYRITATVDHGIWRHDRAIIFEPGGWLYAIDAATGLDGDTHTFRIWWNLPADLTPRVTGPSVFSAVLSGDGSRLWCRSLAGGELIEPVSGQERPLRGWRSRRDRELEPAWSVGFEARDVAFHEFRTLFSFGAHAPERAPTHPFD